MGIYSINGQRVIENSTNKPLSIQQILLIDQAELGLRISRLPIRLIVKIWIDSETGRIRLESYAVRKGIEIKLQKSIENYSDNLIIDYVCYPFDNSYNETISLFRIVKVLDKSFITISQYITLSRAYLDYSDCKIINLVDFKSFREEREFRKQEETEIKGSLYRYQQQGFQWMNFIISQGCGCILADEMGLGKTLQIIALVATRIKQKHGPCLVIAPVSLLENWRREFSKFTNGIDVFIHQGTKRTGHYKNLMDYDVVVTSYTTASYDQSMLNMIHWDLLVLDEAQFIKNPFALRTKSVKAIGRNAGIAVTGTPFENHITDLWSIMDFVIPGGMGSLKEFEKNIPDNLIGAEMIEPFLTPIMLRRRVSDVAKDLPERVDIPQILSLSEHEIIKYEAVRKEILSLDSKNPTLGSLQKLRMFCTHPWLLQDSQTGDPLIVSTKYQRLCELMEEIVSLNEKVILFTSFNRMFEILQLDIPQRFKIKVFSINGDTVVENRQSIVDDFSAINGSALLVLNPRAAGTGLNITAASRVIHYNPEWNPALEDQASARAFRRGQTKTVFVYRLIYKGTVEEIINERIETKRVMFGAVVVGNDGKNRNSDDIVRALLISPGERVLL